MLINPRYLLLRFLRLRLSVDHSNLYYRKIFQFVRNAITPFCNTYILSLFLIHQPFNNDNRPVDPSPPGEQLQTCPSGMEIERGKCVGEPTGIVCDEANGFALNDQGDHGRSTWPHSDPPIVYQAD